MKHLFCLLAAAPLAFCQSWQPRVVNAQFETRPYRGSLTDALRGRGPVWLGYGVPAVRGRNGGDDNCCWNGGSRESCRLEKENAKNTAGAAGGSAEPVLLEPPDDVAILFRVGNDRVEKLRLVSPACAVDAGGLPFVWLTGVPEHDSLQYLESVVSSGNDALRDASIFAIAQHRSPEADEVLNRLVRPSQPVAVREKVMFWLGASRGAPGVGLLTQSLASDPSDGVRDKAVFALSISKQPEALTTLIHAADSDRSPQVRGQALFWLAQKAGARASAAISNAIENDPDTEVKKKAVFALSQLPPEESVPKLIEVARTQRNPEVRKQAFFWLGQSHDPRALNFIEQLLLSK